MPKIRETDVQEWLAFLLRGRREQVLLDLGRLDIILKEDGIEYVIEVKKGTKFLHAIGQIVGYTTFLEKDKKNIQRVRIIALFDWKGMSPDRLRQCFDTCEKMNVHCWLLDEEFLKFMYLLERSHAEAGTDIRPQSYFMEQYMAERIKEQNRLEFHNSLKRGEIIEPIFKEEIDNEIDDEMEEMERQTSNMEI